MLDSVSETYRCDWEKASRMNVYEFLNIYQYRYRKLEYENARTKAEYDKIKSKYKHKR